MQDAHTRPASVGRRGAYWAIMAIRHDIWTIIDFAEYEFARNPLIWRPIFTPSGWSGCKIEILAAVAPGRAL